jgi:hypothetical protein
MNRAEVGVPFASMAAACVIGRAFALVLTARFLDSVCS